MFYGGAGGIVAGVLPAPLRARKALPCLAKLRPNASALQKLTAFALRACSLRLAALHLAYRSVSNPVLIYRGFEPLITINKKPRTGQGFRFCKCKSVSTLRARKLRSLCTELDQLRKNATFSGVV